MNKAGGSGVTSRQNWYERMVTKFDVGLDRGIGIVYMFVTLFKKFTNREFRIWFTTDYVKGKLDTGDSSN